MSFICMRMKNHLQIKDWALNLLIHRPRRTRKWLIRHLHMSHNTPYFVHFSWVLQPSQEKFKTMVMQNLGRQIRCIMGHVQVANRIFSRRIYMKKMFSSQRREMLFSLMIKSVQCSSSQTLFTWSGGTRSSRVGFFCFVSPRAWKQKKPTPLDRGPPLHVNRVSEVSWKVRSSTLS